ncbi:MliC family protein [Paraburkholderia kururiensis]|uniref:MliC family protein n=1 Tax=Paraburkholderia kururiensis TaxID=984307 RepID=A0ABZ0WID9_9BURK|nr:MliC family protein [Paraburkholderia kururiensis]WQD77091.1 MliC family protein [Paraburkholderia kururiensis]
MKKNRKRPVAFAATLATTLTLAAADGNAAPGPLSIGEIQTQARHTFRYTCSSGRTFKVSYLSAANGQSFAVLPVNGRAMLFVNTLAASGAKYQADRYTWWTKGPRADLYDATAGENAPPILADCVTIQR